MSKMLAAPKLNEDGKWNVEVECDGELIRVGIPKTDLVFVWAEWDTKQEAIDYINSKEKLQLRE